MQPNFADRLHPKQQYSLDHIPTLFVATKSDLDLALQVSYFLFNYVLSSQGK